MLTRLTTPNNLVSPRVRLMLSVGWVGGLGLLLTRKPDVFPSPFEIVQAFPTLWTAYGLGDELLSSMTTNLEALLLSTIISLPLAYMSRVPIIAPVAYAVSKLRFLSPAVFFIILLYVVSGGHAVKVWMLALGEAFFLTTTMITVVQNVTDIALDDCRTLRMGEWLTTWYAVCRGTLAQTFDAVRDNAAMGWSMLMMVEGVVRSEGGVGVLLLNQEKHVNFDMVFAILVAILVVGIVQDWLIGQAKALACPWSTR